MSPTLHKALPYFFASLLMLTPVTGCRTRPQADIEVRRAGWFHTVWGEQPQYWLVDESGRWTRLIIGPEVNFPPEERQAMDRKPVTVAGFWMTKTPEAIRVTSIAPASPPKP